MQSENDADVVPSNPAAPSVPPYSLGSKKAVAIDDVCNAIITARKLLSTAGEHLFAYEQIHGCYRPVYEPEKLITAFLAPTGHFSRLSVRKIRDLRTRICWSPSCACSADAFNQQPDLINAKNGVVHYLDNKVTEHSETHRFTYCIQASYLEDISQLYCPSFEQFCQTSLAPLYCMPEADHAAVIAQKRQLLLEIIGYICCDSNAGKCALFLKGEPDNGKSVIANFITQLFFPELISNIPLHKLSDRFNKAELFGKKLNVAGEIQGKKLTEIATFKSITGGDAIFAEFKGKDPFSFTPRCKLLFAGNALPGTAEADATKAFTNRLVVLLFNHSIPKEKQDKNLLQKLWEERDGIFTLALDALRNLHERNYVFTLPEESKQFLNSFAERGNSIQAFLRDCCVQSPGARVHNKDLLCAYEHYCTRNGLEQYSKTRLYELLSGIPGITMKRVRIGNENCWGHTGIQLNQHPNFGTLEQNAAIPCDISSPAVPKADPDSPACSVRRPM